MGRWTCPACEREFARAHQSHVCVPGGTVEDTFAGRPPVQRAIYEAIVDHLASLGPVHVDAVGVGVFLKAESKLAEVRPMARSLNLALALPRPLPHARIARRFPVAAGRIWHVLKLTEPSQVDDQVRDWLTEAYHAAGGPS